MASSAASRFPSESVININVRTCEDEKDVNYSKVQPTLPCKTG